MSNEYYQAGSTPAPNSPGSSATIRGQFAAIAAAFDRLPTMAGSANEFVIVNPSGTALITSGYLFSDFVNLTGSQVLTNKTLAWADNTWVGFGTGATKNAGTGAGNVLLLAENSKLPALDGSQLTNLAIAGLPVIPIAKGGTGAADYAGAQAALGINLKADANNAVLTGAPTCPTPPVGNSSARLANTQFVTDTITAIGAAVPSDATPLMNGAASSGVHVFVSRDDHVHPTDTTRAAASAETAAGTSVVPVGGITSTDVQGALSELDTEKAPLASPALTGAPTSTTPATSDNSTRIATTAFTQSLLAQQPAGVKVSNSTPLMNGAAGPGTGVEASRYDHIHPSDTSRAPTAAPSFTGTLTHSGDVVFSGTGKRITGDFSNATVANRLMFQTSVLNSDTNVAAIPNGTSQVALIEAHNNSNPTNASLVRIQAAAADSRIISGRMGAGAFLPLTFYTNNIPQATLGVDGTFQLSTSNKIAFGTPAYYIRAVDGLELTSADRVRINAAGGEKLRADANGIGVQMVPVAGVGPFQTAYRSTVWGRSTDDTPLIDVVASDFLSLPSHKSVKLQYNGQDVAGNLNFCPSVAASNTAQLEAINTNALVIGTNNAPVVVATGGFERVRVGATGDVNVGESAAVVGARNLSVANYSTDPAATAEVRTFCTGASMALATSKSGYSSVFSYGGPLYVGTATVGTAVVIRQGGTDCAYFGSAGEFRLPRPQAFGYGTGAGGTVTQATSKSTNVTLNTPTGVITTHNAALAGNGVAVFTLNNSTITATSVVHFSPAHASTEFYQIIPVRVFAGGVRIRVSNVTGVSLSEAIPINFVVLNGASS